MRWRKRKERRNQTNPIKNTGRVIQTPNSIHTVHPPLRLRLQVWTHFTFQQLIKLIFLQIEIKYFLLHIQCMNLEKTFSNQGYLSFVKTETSASLESVHDRNHYNNFKIMKNYERQFFRIILFAFIKDTTVLNFSQRPDQCRNGVQSKIVSVMSWV